MHPIYLNAQQALNELNNIDDLIKVPEVNIDQSQLVFKAKEYGQRLTQTLTIQNTVPDTILKAKWSVVYNQKDGLHTPDNHAFINFNPKEFEGNNIRCEVTVDTSQLKSDQKGKRTIILTSNASIEDSLIAVEIETASPPIPQHKKLGGYWLILGTLLIGSVFLVQFLWPIEWGIINTILDKIGEINLWLREKVPPPSRIEIVIIRSMVGLVLLGVLGGALGGAFLGGFYGGALVGAIRGAFLGGIGAFMSIMEGTTETIIGLLTKFSFAIVGAIVGAIVVAILQGIVGVIIGVVLGTIVVIILLPILGVLFIFLYPILVPIDRMSRLGFNRNITSIQMLLTCLAGASMGWLHLVGINNYAILSLTGSSVPLVSMLIYPQIQHRNLIARYRREKQDLIEL